MYYIIFPTIFNVKLHFLQLGLSVQQLFFVISRLNL